MNQGLVDRLLERLNPVLVKEVRQALRGRYFMVVFWLTLAAATVIGCIMLVWQSQEPSDDGGIYFFLAMFGCLSAAVNVFVPFWTFLALGGEWEENTYDLLVLTNLRPRQIVLGKLLSAGVQALLFYSAFAPFLAFAFLLQGLDLTSVATTLGFSLVTSFALSTVALAFSSMTTNKFFRVVLMAILAVLLGQAGILSVVFWTETLFDGAGAIAPLLMQYLVGFMTGFLLLAAFAFAFACTRLAHPEENRSTGLRLLTTCAIFVGLVWIGYFYRSFRPTPELLGGFFMMALVPISALAIFFTTESEALGRRVRLHVPKNPLVACLVAPWLPGGGRGVLLLLVQAVLLGAGIYCIDRLYSVYPLPDEMRLVQLQFVVAALSYSLIYIGYPSFFFSFFSKRLPLRIAARVAVPALAFALFFFPFLLGVLIEDESLLRASHLGNPGWVFTEIATGGDPADALTVLALAAGLALFLNVPRILRGLFEALKASKSRRRPTGDLPSSLDPLAEEGRAVTDG